MNGTCLNKKFTLTEVLNDSTGFTDFLAKRAWFKIKSSPSWQQFVNANNRLENLEQQLSKISNQIDALAISINGGDKE